jgi:hypothetical protein
MPLTPSKVLSAPELLDYDLPGLGLIDDLGGDTSAVDKGCADCRAVGTGDEQDPGENHFGAGFALAAIDDDAVAFADPKLMAAVFKDSVHSVKLLAGRPLARPQVFNDLKGLMILISPASAKTRSRKSIESTPMRFVLPAERTD